MHRVVRITVRHEHRHVQATVQQKEARLLLRTSCCVSRCIYLYCSKSTFRTLKTLSFRAYKFYTGLVAWCSSILDIFTERDGRKGPPAGNKARCDRTNTPHSKATQRKAKPNQTPTTQPTDGARDRPRQPQPKAERDHASGSGQRQASRCTRPTDTGTCCPGEGHC
jgi:hypothetical protein